MSSPSKTLWAVAIGTTLVIATISTSAYWILFKGPVEMVDAGAKTGIQNLESLAKLGGKVLDRLSDMTQFRPRLVIGEQTIIESNQRVAELAVTQKRYNKTYRWEHSYLGSTKKIEIAGKFVAKAGYRLKSPMELRFDQSGGRVTMVLPDAEILSNEMTSYDVVTDDGGLWNRISKEDREKAVNELKASADRFAKQSGLLREADESMTQHLREALEQASETPFEIQRSKVTLP